MIKKKVTTKIFDNLPLTLIFPIFVGMSLLLFLFFYFSNSGEPIQKSCNSCSIFLNENECINNGCELDCQWKKNICIIKEGKKIIYNEITYSCDEDKDCIIVPKDIECNECPLCTIDFGSDEFIAVNLDSYNSYTINWKTKNCNPGEKFECFFCNETIIKTDYKATCINNLCKKIPF